MQDINEKQVLISLKRLAKMIDVHTITLQSWLCHYTLGRYVEETLNDRGRREVVFRFNASSVKAFRKYLSGKKRKYLIYFDARFFDKLNIS